MPLYVHTHCADKCVIYSANMICPVHMHMLHLQVLLCVCRNIPGIGQWCLPSFSVRHWSSSPRSHVCHVFSFFPHLNVKTEPIISISWSFQAFESGALFTITAGGLALRNQEHYPLHHTMNRCRGRKWQLESQLQVLDMLLKKKETI